MISVSIRGTIYLPGSRWSIAELEKSLSHSRLVLKCLLQLVQWAGYIWIAFTGHMSINHGCIYIFMTHEFLDRSNIISRFQKMCCKTMPERMVACRFWNLRFSQTLFYHSLKSAGLNMMAHNPATQRMDNQAFRREQPLLGPFLISIRIFFR